MDHFAAIAHERVAVADLLDSLSDAQWLTPSCCGEWTIEDLAAHLTVVWNHSAFDYVKRSIRKRRTWFTPRAGLDAINAATVTERKATGRTAIVADIRAHVGDRSTPTGFDSRDHPEQALPAVDTATSRRFALFSNRRDLADRSFRAMDFDWSSGTGPEVAGPACSLAHAMWGRESSLDALTGPGVDVLRRRLESRAR